VLGRPGVEAEHHSLHERLRVLRRRKLIILQAALLVPLAAVLYSLQQEHRYRASADVLLATQNPAAQSIVGAPDTLASQDPQRIIDTQAALAREPEVLRRVIPALKLRDRSVVNLLKNTSVSEKQGTNLITFSATDSDKALAVRLASAYANQFVHYERQLNTGALETALSNLKARIARVRHADQRSAFYASLVEKEQQLETLLTLQTATASVVRLPDRARQVQPRPARDGAIAFIVGLILGIGLAFLREALDTRVRTADEVFSHLGLPLLARLPEPSRRLRHDHQLVMLTEPFDAAAEPFRILRTNLEFENLERQATTIMVSSAIEREGKSTTVANLAVALARGGHSVALVDLDLRRPFIHRFFELNEQPGLTDIALGRVDLADALVEVPIVSAVPEVAPVSTSRRRGVTVLEDMPSTAGGARQSKNGARADGKAITTGSLTVLPSGPIPPDPGEFVGRRVIRDILDQVVEHADLVLIDAPPLLHLGDALTLSASVDAMIVVSRMDVVRRRTLTELHRLLATCPATKLGFVVTGANREEGGYGYGYVSNYLRPYLHDGHEAGE
jgi:succinoglycan biosynthesis transport protein ExoP